MKGPSIKDWGKGLNRDQPAFELAPGFWSDCQNMRFRNARAERVGGVASVITPSIVPYFMLPYSSGTVPILFYVGLTNACVHSGSAEMDITPVSLPAPVAVTVANYDNMSAYLTTASAHGLSNGDLVTTTAFLPARMNVANAYVNVTSPTTFYISDYDGTAATYSAATAIGSYSVTASSSGTAVPLTGSVDDRLTGGNFNGVIFMNSPKDGLFYFDQTVTNKLHRFPGTQYVALFGRPFKNFIIQGGQTINSVLYRHRLAWSASADPGSVPLQWAASATNDAGNVDLVSDGKMVDALAWGEDLVVYKEDVRYRVRYVGGNDVFDFQIMSGNHKDDGLLSQNCAVNTPKGQVFLTQGKDVRIHSGGESQSIANGRIQQWLRDNIDTTNQKRSFVTVNPTKNEVWVCFPQSGSSLVSQALVWNWEDDAWGAVDLANVTAGCAGEFPTSIATSPRLLIANSTPKIGLVDSGTTYFGASYTSMLERIGMDFDSPLWKTLSASAPLFRATTTGWTATIYHGSAPTQDGAVTYATGQTYTHGTTREITAMSYSGPWLAWKMTTTAAETPALHSIRFNVIQDGEY